MKTTLILMLLVLSVGCGKRDAPSTDFFKDKTKSLVVGQSTIPETLAAIENYGSETGTEDTGTSDRHPDVEFTVIHASDGDIRITWKWKCTDSSGSCKCLSAGESMGNVVNPPATCQASDVGYYTPYKSGDFFLDSITY